MKRDKEICILRKEGITLKDIGKQFGISRERVRQIVIRDMGEKYPGSMARMDIETIQCRFCKKNISWKNQKGKEVSGRETFKLGFCSLYCKQTFKYELVSSRCYVCHGKDELGKHGKYYKICRACNSKRCAKYRETKNGKVAVRNAVKKYEIKNKDKRSAWDKLNNALENGLISKPKICEACGKKKRLNAHHDDHAKPLEVVWLCHLCHFRRHKLLKSSTSALSLKPVSW